MEESSTNEAFDENEFPTKLNHLTSEVKNFNPSNKNLERTKDFKDIKETDKNDTNLISNTFKSKERNSRLQVKKTNR